MAAVWCLFNERRILVLLYLLCVIATKAEGSHVVGMANINYLSHNRILWKIGKELRARGHRYTQVLPTCAKESYTDIEVKMFNTSVTNEVIEEAHLILMKMGDINSILGAIKLFIGVQNKVKTMYQTFCKDLFNSDRLIFDIKQSVDLILCDVTNLCCPILAAALNVTRVDVIPSGFSGVLGAVYYNYPIAYLPMESVSDSVNAFTFFNRLKSFLTFLAMYGVRSTFSKMVSQKSWEKYSSNSMMDSFKPNAIALIPHDFSLEYARPLTPNIKVIGAVLPDVAQELPDDLERFMLDREVVVVSFGTTFTSFKPDFTEMLVEALGKLPFHVLWRHAGSLPKNIPPNTKIVSWFPQNDVLGHASTKVFVTHGGLNSFMESVYHAVPMLVVPLFVDQHKQATLVELAEIGTSLDKNTVKSEDIVKGLIEIANNKKYKDNALHISGLLQDRQQSPAKEGAYWIEYALKHDGGRHLMSKAYDMPLYQLYMFDVFLFVFLVILLVVCMFLSLCYFMTCWCRKSKHSEKEKKA